MSTPAQVAARIRGINLTRDDAKLMLQAGALAIESQAKKRAPWVSGSLRRDIGTEVLAEGGEMRARIGNSTAIPYAVYQEFGTGQNTDHPDGSKSGMRGGIKPKAYLRGALREKRTEAVSEMTKAAKHLVRAKAKA